MADDSRVHVEAFGARLGRVTLPMGLVLDRLSISASNAEINTDPFEVRLDKWGSLEAELTSADLAAFLNHKAPANVRDFEVRVLDGFIEVTATAKVIVELRVTAICSLRIHDQRKLVVHLERVEGVPMAHGMIQGQLDQINPVLDVSTLPLEIELDAIEADQDTVRVLGRARPAG